MEAAALTLAHDHARAASIATQTADTTVAINEHALAAGEFAKAAEGTGSEEAMRTLRLLEQHHKKLSQLLKFPTDNLVIDSTAEKTIASSAAVSELRSPKSDAGHVNPRRTNAAAIQVPRRMPPRDMSSSIASNLASARGIRSANTRRALSPSVSIQQAPGSLEVPTRRSGHPSTSIESTVAHPTGKPTWVPPISLHQSKAEAQAPYHRASPIAEQASNPTGDEGFNRFYATVENLWTKLSAPLAFAGLPLISEESSTIIEPIKPRDISPKRRQSSTSRPTGGEPDLTKLISRAALRASAHPNMGNDSFCVVPTTGHTVSYANILSFENKEKRRMAASMHSADPDLFDDPDNDDFVDARETPMPPSPGFKKTIGFKGKPGVKELENVVEELYTENQSLKGSIDKLSRRLHAFEISAQSSGLALQESMRLLRPASPGFLAQTSGGAESDVRMATKIKALEEQMAVEEREMQRLNKENEKQKAVISRYRERWEKLKEGAKTRREGGKDGQGGPAKDGESGERL